MEQKDFNYFIHFVNHNKSLTRQQTLRRNRLLARECAKNAAPENVENERSSEKHDFLESLQPHNPKETAKFLSLFENSDGLKFLTHNFDPDSTMDFEGLLVHIKQILDERLKNPKLPKSLKAVLPVIIDGPNKLFKNWTDGEGNSQTFYYSSEAWKKLAGRQHPAANQELAPLVEIVRRTFRVVPPMLDDMANELAIKHASFILSKEKLEKADFYTYTFKLRDALNRIFDDIAQRSPDAHVEMKFNRYREGDYFIRQIEITHIGSEAPFEVNETLEKLRRDGGALASIAKNLCGYCNWSVEALWADGKTYRLNILIDSIRPRIEEIPADAVKGFKHILTYYKR